MTLLPFLASAAGAPDPNLLMIIPFGLLLFCIAAMPFINKHFWEHNYHLFALVFGAVTVSYYIFVLHSHMRLAHVAHEYVSFIALIGSLFVVSGGIHIRVKGESTPLVNCVYLLVGAVLANIIGTTGASMLLIRPWIRSNKYRITAFHIVFFIFIVSNVGGCLTPVGDPPLFLGYLKGVPFWWVLEKCYQGWLVAVLGLIAIFYVIDSINYRRAPKDVRVKETGSETWRFDGLHNIFFLAVILAAVFINNPAGLREVLMIGAAVGSYFTTKRDVHESNAFNFGPIKEVAWLFLGIFATMVPALDYLELHSSSLGVNTEMKFYWFTGALSAVLDNAPTYLTFLAAAFGNYGLSLDNPEHMRQFIAEHDHHLIAISLGAVFFGAVTYIGNGPNFMVKAIAEQSKVHAPHFLEYILKYSLPILIPFFFIVGMLFFSPWRVF
jgi:Na+/H+ antiporter NhaD/arsenite permease-like protein